MDTFQRCVQDLESIDRLLELPHGHDIAREMFRELSPYIRELGALKERDRSGAVLCLFEYAEAIRIRLGGSAFDSGALPVEPVSHRVA